MINRIEMNAFIEGLESHEVGVTVHQKRELKRKMREGENWRKVFIESVSPGNTMGIQYSMNDKKANIDNNKVATLLHAYNFTDRDFITFMAYVTIKKSGGVRHGAGRKVIGVRNVTLTLDDDSIEFLKKKGNGNMSAAIRLLREEDEAKAQD